MIIGSCKVYLNLSYSHSLKEKRMVVKSVISRVGNKFNASIAEVENQDLHQSIVIGFAVVTTSSSHANSMIQQIINFIEGNCEADIVDTDIEII